MALLSFILSPGQSVWLPVTIAMIGKFLISQTFAIAYLYTAELFPTNVRNVAVGTASTFARIGSMSAPYIVDLLVGARTRAHYVTLKTPKSLLLYVLTFRKVFSWLEMTPPYSSAHCPL